ncbi:MAG: peptidoglycan DD-metalloendopeptidase family protein [Oscillospiraceae bacterium]|nr:peptidoglycan DD-metalloendopeptidase family protein [Oscillospiraceae bacterium]
MKKLAKRLTAIVISVAICLTVVPIVQMNVMAATLSWAWPILNVAPVSSVTHGFNCKCYGKKGYHSVATPHKGIDLSSSIGGGKEGAPVIAVADGKITGSNNTCKHGLKISSCVHNNTFGNYVKINHGGGIVSYYGHLSPSGVKKSGNVKKGDIIGYVGTSGASTGYHLHFEVRKNGTAINPLGSDFKYTKFTTSIDPPPKPTGLKAVRKSETSATVSWGKVSTATSYEVQFYSRSKGWIADTDYKTKTAISYVSTGYVKQYTTYDYRVRAVNSGGKSTWATITYSTETEKVEENKNNCSVCNKTAENCICSALCDVCNNLIDNCICEFPCEDCDKIPCDCLILPNCECGINATHELGHILGNDDITIFDFVEVLKYLVDMEDCNINKCYDAFFAALITEESQEKGEPTIFDGIEILQHIVGMIEL